LEKSTAAAGATVGASFGTSTLTPIAFNLLGTNTTRTATSIQKTSGVNGQVDAQGYSSIGTTLNCVLTAKPFISTGDCVIGLNTDPTSSTNWESIDFGIYCRALGDLFILESGIVINLGNPVYNTGDVLKIERVGTSIVYYKNSEVLRTTTVSAGVTLYIDSSIATTNSGFNTITWDSVSFTGNISEKITSRNISSIIADGAIGTGQIGSIALVGRSNFSVKSGTAGARMEMDSQVIKVYDSSGVLRVKLGNLSA
jgi:hypothetical protein